MNQSPVDNYLFFGYLPGSQPIMPLPMPVTHRLSELRKILHTYSEAELVREGARRLKRALHRTLADLEPTSEHVVPLSGGLDSRAILGWLVENIHSSELSAVTIGTPRTWDYELGAVVASSAKVKHYAIDLTRVELTTDQLVLFAGKDEAPVPLFEAYLFHQMRVLCGSGGTYWSGFMGEALTGAHLPKVESQTWEHAKSYFLSYNKYAKSVELHSAAFNAMDSLPDRPWSPQSVLSFDDQLDFGVRQSAFIRPLVLRPQYHYATPFMDSEWVQFMLAVPRKYRIDQLLYKEILQTLFPKLFEIPTKTNRGLPIRASYGRKVLHLGQLGIRALGRRFLKRWNWGVRPSTNYIDFATALRARNGLKETIFENLVDLRDRAATNWVDFMILWSRHQEGKADFADALTLLASLEIYLKAGKLSY